MRVQPKKAPEGAFFGSSRDYGAGNVVAAQAE